MGMSAAQAKLLSLTARRSDINYQLNCLLNAKLGLNTQASDALKMLNDSKLNNNIFVMTTSDNTQTELSFSNLAKEGLTLVDAKGRTIVPSSYQSDPNKLASILPASHPAIKSYDGDFITKEKLKKNYVAIPQNSIPIFNVTDPSKLEQKKVKAADGEPTVKTVFKDESKTVGLTAASACTTNSAITSNFYDYMNANYKDYSLLIADKNHSGNWYDVSKPAPEAGEDKILKTENTKSCSFEKEFTNRNPYVEMLDKAFASELGRGGTYISKMNKDLGLESYTAYNERTFQSDVNWQLCHDNIKNWVDDKSNKNIEYVSNAKQLITALLKHATVDKDSDTQVTSLNSDANIMLLNDIDLDEMLQDGKNNGGLKEFIEDELKSIIDSDNNSSITFSNSYLETYFKNHEDTINQKSSTSGIHFSVLSLVWQRYFGDDTQHDKFNEDFTNFIQIDKFTGAIGGGGFAINNLKMETKDAQFAGMFGTLEDANLNGIYMENANVFAQRKQNDNTSHLAAILANTVTGKTTTLVTAKGNQITYGGGHYFYDDYKKTLSILNSCSDKNQCFGIINDDQRTYNQMSGGVGGIDTGGKTRVSSGWSFQSYSNTKNAYDNYTDYGWRSSGIDGKTTRKDASFVYYSDVTGNNSANGQGHAVHSVSSGKFTSGKTITGCTNNNNQAVNVLGLILANAGKSNSKIRLCRKEDVNSYEDPGIDGSWKNNAKFDDGTSINWDDWNVVDGSYNSETGEYTIVQTHGEETEEYLGAVSLLEFYKNQGVRVESYEDRESGTFTYSAYGYSVDVEYKDDLEKYNSDNYLYKVENNDSSIIIYEREKCVDIDLDNFVFVDDIEALIDKNIKNGVWFIQGASITDSSKFERKSLDEIGIIETTDEEADAIAQAEYERKMREIELREEELDAKIAQLESEDKITNQEIENEQKILKQNIQSSCSTFAG